MSLPPPPPFWKLYGGDESTRPAPPAVPPSSQRTYRMFGELYERDLPASTLHEAALVDASAADVDLVAELRRLNNSLLVNFFTLTELLLTRHEHVRAKLDELAALFVSFHHVVNRYREVQARDTVAGYLERQIADRQRAAAALRVALALGKQAVARVLGELDAVRAVDEVAAAAAVAPPPPPPDEHANGVAARPTAAEPAAAAATTVSDGSGTSSELFIRHNLALIESLLDGVRRPEA